jgi:hypothetical protein
MTHIAYAAANFITTKISAYAGGLDPAITLALNTGIHEALASFDKEKYLNWWWILPLLGVLYLLYKYSLLENLRAYIRSRFTTTPVPVAQIYDIDIEDAGGITTLTDYVYCRGENFPGLRYQRRADGKCYLRAGINIVFKDSGISGVLTTTEQTVERVHDDKKSVVQVFRINLSIVPSEKYKDARAYFNYIENLITSARNQSPNITLRYAKQLDSKSWFSQNYHVGKKTDQATRRTQFMDSFFHQEKEWLWRYCLSVQDTPQVFYDAGQAPYGNFLLYGPPGTGKSTLVYRLGMALGRHIVSVDLSSMSKHDAYWAIRQPSIDGVNYEPNQCIILLEEFDIAIDKLSAKSQEVTQEMGLFSWLAKPQKVKTPPVKVEKKELKPCTCDTSDGDLCDGCVHNDEIVEEEQKQEEEQKKSASESLTAWSNIKKEFTVEDLLELLQGPVPSDQALIFATTNKYQEIKKKCPALFRPGRLTPVHFDHLTVKCFQELCQYHFKQEMKECPEKIVPSTAAIISMVMKAKTTHTDVELAFAYFQQLFLESCPHDVSSFCKDPEKV